MDGTTLIARRERVVFWGLLILCLLLTVYLFRLRGRAHIRLESNRSPSAIASPIAAQPQRVTLLVADDVTGALSPSTQTLALPTAAAGRARVLLQFLMAYYAQPASTHPLPPGKAIEEVFLLKIPASPDGIHPAGEMAVVNLTPDFADAHPSGIEPETLTLLSVNGTLHANIPEITEVRFLVDGHGRDTLAGHADLTRDYVAADPSTEVHP